MSKRIFTREQIHGIAQNKNVVRCSEKSITYHNDFRIYAVQQYENEGKPARQIFKEAGFNLDVIGRKTPKDSLRTWRKIVKMKGVDGLSKETRGGPGRRHSLRKLTDQEKIKYLENQVVYLKAENSFLAKLRANKKR